MKTIRQSIANPLRTDSPRYGERWRDRSTVGSGVIVNHVALSYNAFNQLIEDAQSRSGAVTGSTPKVGYSYANASGVILERYSYTAFGLATVLTPGFTARAATTFAWNFLFHGQFRDVETCWDNYGYRYYVPALGRWRSRDPIEERGGVNLYAMVANDAVNDVDLHGLERLPSGYDPTDPQPTTPAAPRPPVSGTYTKGCTITIKLSGRREADNCPCTTSSGSATRAGFWAEAANNSGPDQAEICQEAANQAKSNIPAGCTSTGKGNQSTWERFVYAPPPNVV